MLPIIALINFIFFKGMTPLLLDGRITVLGALILAIVVAIVSMALGVFTNLLGLKWVEDAVARRASAAPFKIVGALFCAIIVSVLAGYFVLIGFSDGLVRRIRLFEDFGNTRYNHDGWLSADPSLGSADAVRLRSGAIRKVI